MSRRFLRAARRALCAAGLVIGSGITPAEGAAQDAAGAAVQDARGTAVQDAPGTDGSFWSTLAGTSADRRRFVFGMWAMHPFEPQFPEVEWTRGFGAAWGQFVAATFINSYDERAFIAGIERYWARGSWAFTEFGVGYRVGLVTGYDERLISWAEYVPVLPFGGIVGWFDAGPFALDVYYVYRAITLETAVRF